MCVWVCGCHPAPTLRLCVINLYLLAWWILMWLSFASFVLNALLLPLKQWFFTCTKRTRMHFLQLIMSCGAGVAVGVRETGAISTVVVAVDLCWIFRFCSLKNATTTWVFRIRKMLLNLSILSQQRECSVPFRCRDACVNLLVCVSFSVDYLFIIVFDSTMYMLMIFSGVFRWSDEVVQNNGLFIFPKTKTE